MHPETSTTTYSVVSTDLGMGSLPPPPLSILNPLLQLDEYLRRYDGADINDNHDSNNSSSRTNTAIPSPPPSHQQQRQQQLQDDQQIDELLTVAEFLYGHTLLSSSLMLIDAWSSSSSSSSSYSSYSSSSGPLVMSPNTGRTTVSGLTTVIAPSGRSINLIQGLSKTNQTYLCLVGNNNNTTNNNMMMDDGTTEKKDSCWDVGNNTAIHYCSCRSYLDKSTKDHGSSVAGRSNGNGSFLRPTNQDDLRKIVGGAIGGISNHHGPPICKHVLALKLFPYLCLRSDTHHTRRIHNNIVRTATEEEFAQLILDRVWGGQY